MSDLELINSLSSEPVRPVDHVSIETIIQSVPCMAINTPATYALYLHYNKKHLADDEKVKVELIIERLQKERSRVNKYNMDYMDRDLDEENKPPHNIYIDGAAAE